MRFRVLGPLTVADQSTELTLGGPQQQTVLAVLLAHSGTMVSTDRLIDEVWGESPPDAARKAVQSYVAQLRKTINVEEELLRSQPPGYVIDAKPDQLDSASFERLVEEGRSLLRSDPASAAVVLREALALWGGEPFEGLVDRSPSLREATARLEESRLLALEDRIEAELLSGQAGVDSTELARLTAEQPYREKLRALHMLALYRSGRQADALRVYDQTRITLAADLGLEPSPDLQRLHQRILEHDPLLESASPFGSGPTREAGQPRRNPYKGLRSFEESDAADFFGRRDLVLRLVDRLRSRGSAGRFVALVGPSGSGKSSVVKAGLVPRLRAGAVPGSETWSYVTMFPDDDPFGRLATGLAGVGGGDRAELDRRLRDRDDGVVALSAAATTVGPLVLVVDQFEEVFTLVPDRSVRDDFLDLLVSLAGSAAADVRVVVTMRADFVDRPLQHPRFAPTFEQGLVLVSALEDHEVRDVIVEPAARAGVRVEPELVAAMVTDVGARPATLPLLQFALTDLFERCGGEDLRVAEYRAAGGISGALGLRADDVYLESSPAEQAAARQLFSRLVTITDDGEPLRRRVTRHELDLLRIDDDVMERILERYGDQRLLTFDHDRMTGEASIEIAHEALLGEWPRLAGWLTTDREDLLLHRRLATATADWIGSERDTSYLATGTQLDRLETLAERSALVLTDTEHAYMDAARRESDLRERRTARLRRALITVLGAATVVAIGLSVLAFDQRGQARDQASFAQEQVRIATARELAAAADNRLREDPELSILLALEAIDVTRSVDATVIPAAEESLHRAVQASRIQLSIPAFGGAFFGPDGSRIVTGGTSGTNSPAIRDSATGETILALEGHTGPVFNAVFSPDGTRVATNSADLTTKIWDAATGSELITLPGHGQALISVAISPDSSLVATSSADAGSVKVWDVRTGAELREFTSPAPLGINFSPDGTLLAAADPVEGVMIWELESGELVDAFQPSPPFGFVDVAFGPDGRHVVAGGDEKVASVLDIRTGEVVNNFFGHAGSIQAVAFSSDGARVATGTIDGTARVWDAATGRELVSLAGHGGAVINVDFSPDGTRLITGATDDRIRVWDVSSRGSREWLTLADHAFVIDVAYSPDGTRLATSGFDRTGRVWDATSGEELLVLSGHEGPVRRIDFDPDGAQVVTASFDGNAIVWDAATGSLVSTLAGTGGEVGRAVFGPDGARILVASDSGVSMIDRRSGETDLTVDIAAVADVAWSPSGDRFAVSDFDGFVRILDSSSGAQVALFDGHAQNFEAAVLQIDFSPDGTRIATASWDGSARILDAGTAQEIFSLEGHVGEVWAVTFSPDGTRVATGGADGTIRIWNTDTGRQLLTLTGHEATVTGLAFGPDGRRLATASEDQTARVYALDLDELIAIAESRVTRSLSAEERRQYLHSAE